MDAIIRDKIQNQLTLYQEHIKIPAILPHITYGTAGFRGEAASIKHLFFKVGIITGLRCLHAKSNVGVMITASHNPVQDNGVKLIDSHGEMLEPAWEQLVERFCNMEQPGELLDLIETICKTYQIVFETVERKAQVLLGMDTRPSSEALASLVKQGIELWLPLVSCIEFGQLTTPLLHYIVAKSNINGLLSPEPYYRGLIEGVHDIFNTANQTKFYSSANLVVDCANGVGFETMNRLCSSETFCKCLKVKLINSGEGILNKLCGADFVKSTHMKPVGALDPSARYASLDGDADRLVYFYLTGENLDLHLLDGDKILALFAIYIGDMLKLEGLEGDLSLGIVQTAYANGASTDYLKRELKIKNVECVDTGVKNLHARAIQFDIGLYFEANGHGTIWFSEKAKILISRSQDQRKSNLSKLLNIINNYVGDAISDMLVVETILLHYDWNIETWDKLYVDKANSLTKVKVADKNQFETTNAGRTCIRPLGLKAEVDKILSQYEPGTRCFIRASGTEDCVRIYAEANDQDTVNKLSIQIEELVSKFCST